MLVRVLLAVAMIAAPDVASGASGASAQDTSSSQVPTIVTSGHAVVRLAPDLAFVTAAVESRAKNPRDAQRQNAEAMAAVQQKVLVSGIGRDAVRTLGYSIQQEFDFVNGRRVPRDYAARNAVEIKVEALDRVGDLLDAVVQAGATSVSDVRFDLRDRSGAEREALRLAVVDARARAEAAASGAGRQIERVLKVEEGERETPPMPRPMTMARMAQDAPVETPVAPGTIEIHARVTLTVSIK